MTHVLFETAAGYALFKVKDDGALGNADTLREAFSQKDAATRIVNLSSFSRFKDTIDAVKEASSISEGKMSESLRAFLCGELLERKKKRTPSILVSDTRLGSCISKETGLKVLGMTPAISELFRGMRQQLDVLLEGITPEDMKSMNLGLSHSLSRHHMKFSSDKVDIMIIQAVALLDDLDKQLNLHSMRVKEWYGWHFPELSKILQDNDAYAKVVMLMGVRGRAKEVDLTDVLPLDVCEEVKEAAQLSMGTDLTVDDIENIQQLAEQVVELGQYKMKLQDYLSSRMFAIAPNLTTLLGETVGARLISHAGSLLSLSKQPASTLQILGAEKALFRALKNKKNTPKYGLLFHASVVGSVQGKHKAQIARSVAAKAALCCRVDALQDSKPGLITSNALGAELKEAVIAKARAMELGKSLPKMSISRKIKKYEPATLPKETYDIGKDAVMTDTDAVKKEASTASAEVDVATPALTPETKPTTAMVESTEKKEKKKKKEKRKKVKDAEKMDVDVVSGATVASSSDKKSGRNLIHPKVNGECREDAMEMDGATEESTKPKKKKKKKSKDSTTEGLAEGAVAAAPDSEQKTRTTDRSETADRNEQQDDVSENVKPSKKRKAEGALGDESNPQTTEKSSKKKKKRKLEDANDSGITQLTPTVKKRSSKKGKPTT